MRSDVPKAPAATGEDRAKLIEHLVDSSEHKFEVELDWPTSGLSTARDAEVVKSFSQVTYGSLSQALAKESGATWVDRALQSGGVKLSAGGGEYSVVSSLYGFGRFVYLLVGKSGHLAWMFSYGIPNRPQVVFMPDDRAFLWRGTGWTLSRKALINSISLAQKNWDSNRMHLSRPEFPDPAQSGILRDSAPRRMSLLVPPVENFAHQIAHFHSGIWRLEQEGLLRSVDTVWDRSTRFFGDLEEIFPSLEGKVRSYDSDSQLNREIALAGELIFPATGFVLSDGQKRRYLNKEHRCDFPATPKIWLSLRSRDRIWVEQEQGFEYLIRTVQAEFPQAQFYIDGFSLPNKGKHFPAWETAISAMKDMAERIKMAAIYPEKVKSLVGLTIGEAVTIGSAIDLYVSGLGSAQHKIGWFAPSADAVLLVDPEARQTNLEAHSAFSCSPSRGEIRLVRGVATNALTGLEISIHRGRSITNFSLDPLIPTIEVLSLLRQRK